MNIFRLLLVATYLFVAEQRNHAVWTLETQIGTDFETFAYNDNWPQQIPTAIVAVSATNCYLATYWEDSGANYSQILKWTSAGGWSIVPNSFVSHGVINTMSYYSDSNTNYLFIGGRDFTSLGTNAVSAQNLGRLNLTTGQWTGSANGFYSGEVKVIKAKRWGDYPTSTPRCYVYVLGPASVGGNSCNQIARTYFNGSSWVWDTMNGGITGGSHGAWTMDVDEWYGYDENQSAYTHKVYVGGDFTHAGSLTATNIAAWSDYYSEGWSRYVSGNGVGYQIRDYNNNCEWRTLQVDGKVNALAVSGSTVYLGGTFNRVGTSGYTQSGSPYCDWLSPIGLAKITSYFTLGFWNSSAPKSAWTDENGLGVEIRSIATSGSDTFIACGQGIILKDGGNIPTGSEPRVNAYRVNGTTWETIQSNADIEYLQVSAAGTAAFFIVGDENSFNGFSIRRYRN